jgi:hypothetical protein
MAFPDGWAKKVAVTVPDGQVAGSLAGFSVLLTHANASFPASLFADARSDGGDIRASSDAAGTAQLPVDLIAYDAGGTLVMRVKVDLTDGAANTVWIWYGAASETLPAATDTYGRHNAYDANWVGYWPLESDGTNRTAATADLTAFNAPTFQAGKVGAGVLLDDASSEYLERSDAVVTAAPLTLAAWVRVDALPGDQTVLCLGRTGGSPAQNHYLLLNVDGAGVVEAQARDSSTAAHKSTAGSVSVGTWAHCAGVFASASSRVAYKDAVAGAEETTTRTPALMDRTVIGRRQRATPDNYVSGDVDDAQVHSAARSAAWLTTEYNQAGAPATFATWGAPQDTTGGGGGNRRRRFFTTAA